VRERLDERACGWDVALRVAMVLINLRETPPRGCMRKKVLRKPF
jgi:hypothetical protein